jgi:hypothetical protein
MGFVIFILLVILIATVGFWDALAAIMGAAVLMAFVVVLGIGLVALGGYLLLRKS